MASSPYRHGGWDHAGHVVAKVTGRRIQLKDFRLKDGNLVRNEARLPVNIRLKQAGSKRVRVAKKGQTQ